MNNSSMRTADRLTHLKVVCVSLVATLAVVSIGIAASPRAPDMGPQLEARPAGKLVRFLRFRNVDHPLISH